jgi:hypothetical protein
VPNSPFFSPLSAWKRPATRRIERKGKRKKKEEEPRDENWQNGGKAAKRKAI